MNEKTKFEYDAIVIGSGISGGWAVKELCKYGAKTLLLERGRDVEHIKDYPTAHLQPWEFKNGMHNTNADINNDPVQSVAYDPSNKHFFVSDKDNPYIQEQPFNWFRGHQIGGRSLIWGRQCYRMSDLDFEANLKDGNGVDWPIRYKDIERWYHYVESYIGVSGRSEGLQQLPDGTFLPPMELNCIEEYLDNHLRLGEEKRLLTIARVANLTKRLDNRGPCTSRNLCTRGCPLGGYFSTNSSTLPAALSTGNLTIRPFSVVSEIIYDDQRNRATGVKLIDAISHEEYEYRSRIIFLNASTISSAALLLNSKSNRFPTGLGNDSGQIGHNLMDHHSSAGASAIFEGHKNRFSDKSRPCGFLIPRFRNLEFAKNKEVDFLRGYNFQGHGERQEWFDKLNYLDGFGKSFKKELTTPGPWTVWMAGWGECLPYFDNKIYLDKNKTDKWGLPLIRINFSFRENEKSMMDDIRLTGEEILTSAGFTQVRSFDYKAPGGTTVHEMGTARMGIDPKTSVLNCHNQLHSVRNVFITDGSCMTSSGCQNPSLTYMALTARACNFAVSEMKKSNI